MNSLLLFLIKSTLNLSLLYLAFRLLMRDETFFKLSRLVLLLMVLTAIAIPFINSPQLFRPMASIKLEPIFQSYPIIEESVPTAISSEVIKHPKLSSEVVQPVPISFTNLFLYVYLSGVIVSILMLIYSIGSVLFLFRKAKRIKLVGALLKIVPNDIPAFSFGRNILISRQDYETNSKAIITHELVHIKLGHFYDLMLMETIKIIFWFNPLVYRMVRDLKEIHEFQADDFTLNSGIDSTQYQLLIIQKGVGPRRFALANSFNHCQIKKRITMMNKQKTSKAWRWKVATFLPLLALLLMAFGKTGVNAPPEKSLFTPILSEVSQDSVKVWAESDFKVFTRKNSEDAFFKNHVIVNFQIDANSKITVDGDSLSLAEVPSVVKKWLDYKYAEQNEWIHYQKVTVNGRSEMSPKTVMTVRKDPSTNHSDYVKLINIVANTVLKIREDYSQEIYRSSYQKITSMQRKEVDKLIPMNVAQTNAILKKVQIAPPPPKPVVTEVKLPPPPPPKVLDLGIQITLNEDKIWINRKTYSLDELKKMLNEINPQKDFIQIDTHSTSSKELVENIKSILEKQGISYQIKWSNL